MDLEILTGLELLVSIINNSKLKLICSTPVYGRFDDNAIKQIEEKLWKYHRLLLLDDHDKVNCIDEIDILTKELFEDIPKFTIIHDSVSLRMSLLSDSEYITSLFIVKYFNNKLYGKIQDSDDGKYKNCIFRLELNCFGKCNDSNLDNAKELLRLLNFDDIDIQKFEAC